MKKKEIYILTGISILYFIYLLFIYSYLPSDLPMQFSANGSVNWTLPKLWGVLLSSSIAYVVLLSAIFSNKKFNETLIVFLIVLIFLCAFLGYIAYSF